MNDKTSHNIIHILDDYYQHYDCGLTAFRFGVAYSTIHRIITMRWNDYMEQKHLYNAANTFDFAVCSVFGCGHHLSPQEQLYGSRCPEHSIKQAAIDPTAFTVYK